MDIQFGIFWGALKLLGPPGILDQSIIGPYIFLSSQRHIANDHMSDKKIIQAYVNEYAK